MTKKQQRSSRRKNGIRIRETGPRQFEADFSVSLGDGKRLRFRRVSPVRTIEGTRAWAEREREAIIRRGGKVPSLSRQADPDKPRSFRYWGSRWLADAEALGINQPSTLNNKRKSLEHHLIPAFGSRSVAAFEERDFQNYMIERRKAGAAHETVRKEATYLKAVLKHAKHYGSPVERALQVPLFRLRAPAEPRVTLPTALSEAQTRALLVAATDPLDRALFTCLFRQGLRIGEVLGLRWGEDLDLEARRMQIQRAWRYNSKGGSWGPPKSGKSRTIAIDPETLEALQALGEGEHGELVFPALIRRDLGRPMSRGSVMRRLGSAAQTAKIKAHLTTKTGRHSLGRHWAERGWPMRGLQEFLGHHDVAVTQIYAHWSVDATAELLDSRIAAPQHDELAELRALLTRHGIEGGGDLIGAVASILEANAKMRRELEDSGKPPQCPSKSAEIRPQPPF